MTKRELIDEIMEINHTAEPDFLAGFDDNDLDQYLSHLHEASQPRQANTKAFGTEASPVEMDWPRSQEQPHLMGSGQKSWLF